MQRTRSRWLLLAVLALGMTLAGCTGSENDPALGAPTETPSRSITVAAPSPSPSPFVAPPTATPHPTPTRTPVTSSAPTSVRPAADAPMIVIDPGHSGRTLRSTDAKTGLRDIDYPNYPEIYEMFDVSYCVRQGLVADGYRAKLTKARALDSVSLAQRAKMASQVQADLAISVHDDHSQGPEFQATYSQRGVQHGGSYSAMYRGSGSHRTVFRDHAVAVRSQAAAEVIAAQRTKAQQRRVSVRENTFTGRPPLEPGNLALVQLLTTVPWVYNEMGARTAASTTRAMSIGSETAYATGLLLGVEAAVPLSGGKVDQPSAGARSLDGCLRHRVEPNPRTYSRPKRYLPYGF